MFSLFHDTRNQPLADTEDDHHPLGAAGLDLCIVGDSSRAATRRLCAEVVGDNAVTLLDLTLAPATVPPDGLRGHVILKDDIPRAHDYTPLVSLCTYHWLAARRFDMVVFATPFGSGYYSMVAKDLGLAFAATTLVVAAKDCHARTLEQRQEFPRGRTDIELDFLERQTVARADGISAAPGFLDWCRKVGWAMPSITAPPFALRRLRGSPSRPAPSISVCLAAYNRPELLRQAVGSLLRQTASDFEVIVVDDGSTHPDMAACLAEFAAEFARRDWRIIRQDNTGPAGARNTAAARARGEYLMFMDDDNLALAHEIERFATAARVSDADVLTCIPGHHPESDAGPPAVAHLPTPDPEQAVCGVDWTPVGACLALATMVNCLGDCNALFRRSAFEALGGFQGDKDFAFEDLRLLMLAAVRGLRFEVVPEILFLYRRHQDSRSMYNHLFRSHVKCLEPFTELLPPALWPLLLTVHRDWYDRHRTWSVTPETTD